MSKIDRPWKMGKTANVEVGNPAKDEVAAGIIKYYSGNKNGYSENDIDFHVGKNGFLSLSHPAHDSYIYLYPEQVALLRKIFKKIK